MYCGQATESDLIFDDDMPAQEYTVGHDDPVSNGTVVGDVGAGKDQAAIADPGDFATLLRSPVHSAMLTKDIIRTNFCPGFFTIPFLVLRVAPSTAPAWITFRSPILVLQITEELW